MGWVALAVVGSFALVAIPLRIWAQRRWTGRSGVTLDWRAAAPAERTAAGLLGASVVGVGVAILLAVSGVAVPWTDDSGVVVVLGLALSAAGVALAVYGQLVMGASWRIGIDAVTPTDLVMSGPFRVVRNPIYTAMICFVAGIAVLLRSPMAVAGLVLLVSALELQVRRVEEPFLATRHGDRYIAWASSTGRFVPHLGRVSQVVVPAGRYRGSSGTTPPVSRREAPRAGQRGG